MLTSHNLLIVYNVSTLYKHIICLASHFFYILIAAWNKTYYYFYRKILCKYKTLLFLFSQHSFKNCLFFCFLSSYHQTNYGWSCIIIKLYQFIIPVKTPLFRCRSPSIIICKFFLPYYSFLPLWHPNSNLLLSAFCIVNF